MPKLNFIKLGMFKPHTFIHTGNVIMLKTKEHPNGFLHLIEETDAIHNSRSYIDLRTRKHINNGEKISDNDIKKYKIELTEKEIIEFFEKNLKEMYNFKN